MEPASFFKKKFKVCGVDPVYKPAKISNLNGIECINDFFNEKVSRKFSNTMENQNLLLVICFGAYRRIDKTFKLIYNLLEVNGFFV